MIILDIRTWYKFVDWIVKKKKKKKKSTGTLRCPSHALDTLGFGVWHLPSSNIFKARSVQHSCSLSETYITSELLQIFRCKGNLAVNAKHVEIVLYQNQEQQFIEVLWEVWNSSASLWIPFSYANLYNSDVTYSIGVIGFYGLRYLWYIAFT